MAGNWQLETMTIRKTGEKGIVDPPFFSYSKKMRIILKTTPEGIQIEIPDDEIRALLKDVSFRRDTFSKPQTSEKKNEREEKAVLNIEEASDLLGIKKNTLYIWALQRRIPSVKIGNLRRFIRKDLLEWFEEHKVDER